MFQDIEVPYYSSSPLSEKTEWVAFPVLVSIKSKDYISALVKAKGIVSELLEISNKLLDERCSIVQASDQEEYKKLQTIVEFSKNGANCTSDVYNYIIIKFGSKIPFWEKMEIITKHLDSISNLSCKYKSDKNLNIIIGMRYHSKK